MRGILWSDLVKRVSLAVLAVGVTILGTGVAVSAQSSKAVVPEISGASLSAGLGLLGAGLLWLRARRKVK